MKTKKPAALKSSPLLWYVSVMGPMGRPINASFATRAERTAFLSKCEGNVLTMSGPAVQESPIPWQLGGWGEIYSAGVMPMAVPGPLPTAHMIAKISGTTDLLGMSKDEARANQALIVRRVNQGPAFDAMLKAVEAYVMFRGGDGIVWENLRAALKLAQEVR